MSSKTIPRCDLKCCKWGQLRGSLRKHTPHLNENANTDTSIESYSEPWGNWNPMILTKCWKQTL